VLHVENVSFSYGNREILGGISFDAKENEIVSILGPNGVGKTTLLKCLCGIYRPGAGRVSVGGADVTGLAGKELAKKIGYVPQSAPVSRTTVYDSVLLGRRPHIDMMITRKDLDIVSSVIDALDMSDLALRYLTEISGGEFQKVQIARAMAQEPSVLILDEPTNNLDLSNQHMSMHMISDAVRSRGMCTLMTMHDVNLAIHYSDRLMFIKDGTIYAYGGSDIVTEDLVRDVYGIEADVIEHRGGPLVVPRRVQPGFTVCRHDHDHEHPHSVADHIHGAAGK
jgi:iron complex transport system ATP-binding protein